MPSDLTGWHVATPERIVPGLEALREKTGQFEPNVIVYRDGRRVCGVWHGISGWWFEDDSTCVTTWAALLDELHARIPATPERPVEGDPSPDTGTSEGGFGEVIDGE